MKRTYKELTETNGKRLIIDVTEISFAEEIGNNICRIITRQGANISVASSYVDLVKKIID